MKNKTVVVLTGCGVYDGSEINEAVITLKELEKHGIQYQCYSFDKDITPINHLDNTPEQTTRNCLQEASRIARGDIKNIKKINPSEYYGMIVIGGLGVKKVLSNYNEEQLDFEINKEFYSIASIMRDQRKISLYMCIAPILLPKIYKKPICTIGHNEEVAEQIRKMGGITEEKDYNEYSFDSNNMIISTPAFMEAKNLKELEEGIANAITKYESTI